MALPFFLFKKQVIKYISIGVLINKNYLKKLKLNLVYFFIDYITQKKIEIKFFILPYSIHSLPVTTLQIAMSVITMPSSFDESIRACCADAVSQAVTTLAAKYGFSVDEARAELQLDEIKIVRKRGPVPKKTAKKASKASKAAAKADATTPKKKRKITGYLLFSRENRDDVKAELVDQLEDGVKLKPQDTVRALATAWKELSSEEKARWNELAADEASSEDDEDDEDDEE